MNQDIIKQKLLEQYKVALAQEKTACGKMDGGDEASRSDYYYWLGERCGLNKLFQSLFPEQNINETITSN